MSARKRSRRDSFGGFSRKVNKVDKKIISINQTAVANSQVNTDLITANFPCTIVGLRWNITVAQDAGTGNGVGRWAIVRLKDGMTADTLQGGDGGTLYNPEQEVMAFGYWQTDNNIQIIM